MLDDLIGPAPFADALRDGVAAGRAGPMTLESFKRLVEQRAARRLDWFFDQWLERATRPVLALEDARDTADARSVVIGVEGEWPVTEVIPHVPWREIRYRNGRMVGASAPPPPRIEIWLDKHR